MTAVVLDTSHWITFEHEPSVHSQFLSIKQEYGFDVSFSRGNFEDLAKSAEQDELSQIIANTTDQYVAVDDYLGDDYFRDSRPTVLAPPAKRNEYEHRTSELTDGKTIELMFRRFGQDPGPEFEWTTLELKRILDEHGEQAAKATLFYDYLEPEDDERTWIRMSESTPIEYVRKMLLLEYIKQLKDEEQLKSQDYLDLEILAHAVYDSDVFIGESKWVNADIIPSVIDGISGVDAPIIVSSFDEFFEVIGDFN